MYLFALVDLFRIVLPLSVRAKMHVGMADLRLSSDILHQYCDRLLLLTREVNTILAVSSQWVETRFKTHLHLI